MKAQRRCRSPCRRRLPHERMWLSIRLVVRHPGIVQIVLTRANNEVTASESNLLAPAGNIVPRVAWLRYLVVPGSRLVRGIAGYLRTARSPRPVNRLNDLVKLEPVADPKIQIAKQASRKCNRVPRV